MSEYKLEEWFLNWLRDTYDAPERMEKTLVGNVFGHPKFEDGSKIETSPIREIDGKRIHTQNGDVYLLGEIKPDYLRWLTEEGIVYDEKNPIAMKKSPLEMNMAEGVPRE